MILLSVFNLNAAPLACSGDNLVTDPVPFAWIYHPVTENNLEAYCSGVMEISEASFIIDGETLTTRAYGQAGSQPSIPGPTMILLTGEKYALSFHNKLAYKVPSTAHNVFKDPNIRNIHK